MKPIVTGRLSKIDNDNYTLMGHLGDVEAITLEEYTVLKAMNGFNTMEKIAGLTQLSIDKIQAIYDFYCGEKKITGLAEWNRIGWCVHCQIHVAGGNCGICGRAVKKIVFAPPADPFICFDEEKKFILTALHENFGIVLSEQTLFLVNCGVNNNIFFWEIEYAGQIIMHINFNGHSADRWEYCLRAKADEINNCSNCLWNESTKKKLIMANQKHLNRLVRDSEALMAESARYFSTKPLLYFSAGKESMVMLSILRKIRIAVNILTVVTGVEFPEDILFIDEMRKNIENDKLFQYYFFREDGKKIIDTLNQRRVLSAQNPWCRTGFKRELKSKGTELIYQGADFIAYEGSRWYENDFRRRHPKINFLSDYMHQVWVHPLIEWTAFDIWLYIWIENLPINPVYFKGFQRTTCWLCPIVNPFHLYCSRKYYPELWKKIADCRLEAFGDDQTHDLPF